MEYITGHWLSVIVGVYLVGMMLYGHYRGVIRMAVSLLALGATILIVHIGMPYVTGYLKESTAVHQVLQKGIMHAVGFDQEAVVGESNSELQFQAASIERNVIEGLKIPDQLKKTLIENNNSEVYKMLGVQAFADYIGSYLTDVLLNGVGYILMFLIVWIVLRILVGWLDLVAKLPLISGMNQIAGAVLGLAEGLVVFWIFCILVGIFSATGWGKLVTGQIEGSWWLKLLYQGNVLSKLVLGLIYHLF